MWSAGTIVSSGYQVRGQTEVRGQWDDCDGEQRAGLRGINGDCREAIGQSEDWGT